MGRPGIISATDYLDERMADTRDIASIGLSADSAFATEVPSSDAKDFAKGLDSISPLVQRAGSVESYFKEFFTHDLDFGATKDSLDQRIRSELGTKFSEVSRNKAEELTNRLRDLQGLSHFSRATIEAATRNKEIPFELVSGINLRSSGLYHAANALACDATLFTWANFGASIPSGVSYAHQFSLSPENPYLFLEVLRIFGIPPSILDHMPVQTIQRLAVCAPEVKAFVKWYKTFVEQCLVSSGNLASSKGDAIPLIKRLDEKRESALRHQRNYERVLFYERCKISWFLGALGLLTTYNVSKSFSGWSLTKGSADLLLKTLRNRCEKFLCRPIGDFEALIIREGLAEFDPTEKPNT
jgi:hypothetical protein